MSNVAWYLLLFLLLFVLAPGEHLFLHSIAHPIAVLWIIATDFRTSAASKVFKVILWLNTFSHCKDL
jgi:hypothetical protein